MTAANYFESLYV